MAIRDSQDITLVPLSGQPKARVSQDFTLVPFAGQPKVRVSQELTLVAYSRPVGNATQLMTWDEPDLQYIIRKRRNEAPYIQASVPVFQTTAVFFPVVFVVT